MRSTDQDYKSGSFLKGQKENLSGFKLLQISENRLVFVNVLVQLYKIRNDLK